MAPADIISPKTKVNILLVDDQPTNLLALETILKGSEFTIRLPVLDEAEEQAGEQRQPAPTATRRRVLGVDDNVDAAESLALLLRLAGHDVRVAYNGPAALETSAHYRPDLILLDIGLPGMSSYEVAPRLREIPGRRDARLVAITGYGQAQDRRRSTEAGFDDHLVKPVDPAALQRLLTSSPAR